METIEIKHRPSSPEGKVWGGIVIIATGLLLLLKQYSGIYMPEWLVSWPMWFILLGLYLGARYNFTSGFGYFVLIFGTVNLTQFIFTGFNPDVLFWPVLLMGGGLWLVFRRKQKFD